MGQQHHRDLAAISMAKLGFRSENTPRKPRSFRQLATEAAQYEYGSTDPSTIDRLRQAFSKDKDFWLEMGRSHDDVHESIEHQILESLKETLATVGIEMKLTGPGGELEDNSPAPSDEQA